MKSIFLIGCFFCCSFFSVALENLDYSISFEDNFSPTEKRKVEAWLEQTSAGVYRLFGKYPFTVHYYIHRRDNANEPVPWANTVRDGEEGVHFHIDPGYKLEEFLADWTAPHEISHLAIPYVGRENMWFSEGFASYFQYLVMAEMGVITYKEAESRLTQKIRENQPKYLSNKSFLEMYQRLRSQHDYPGVYWGGAAFFFQIDTKLVNSVESSMVESIQAYQSKFRIDDTDIGNLDQLIEHLDLVSKSTIFSDLFRVFQQESAEEALGLLNL